MTSEEFVERINIAAYESSIHGVLSLLERPPGRRPSPSLVVLAKWYSELSALDKERVRSTIQLAGRAAIFAMLTILDGVRSIQEDGEPKGSLELRYVTGAESILLNDPGGEFLHDLFAAKVPPI